MQNKAVCIYHVMQTNRPFRLWIHRADVAAIRAVQPVLANRNSKLATLANLLKVREKRIARRLANLGQLSTLWMTKSWVSTVDRLKDIPTLSLPRRTQKHLVSRPAVTLSSIKPDHTLYGAHSKGSNREM